MAELRAARPLLGTLVDIHATGASDTMLRSAMTAAFAAIERVHRGLSVHAVDSELSQINRNALHSRQAISADLRTVLTCALDLADRSRGSFDPSVGGLLGRWGLLPEHAALSTPASWRDVDLTADGVRFANALTLDFGGIAKGYAVDCAVAALQDRDVPSGCVNAGGDLRVFGRLAQPVHLRTQSASESSLLPLLSITQGSVATSCYPRQRGRDYNSGNDRWVSALVDARTFRPRLSARHVSVIAESCMIADGLTKIVALRGVACARLLAHFGASAAILSPSRGTWRCTMLPNDGVDARAA
jgi:FAD:protein FMN transferase